MINKQIKSHWRLAWRTLRAAVKVTCSVFWQGAKARLYIIKINESLMKKRREQEKAIVQDFEDQLERLF